MSRGLRIPPAEAIEFIAFVTSWGQRMYVPVFLGAARAPELHHALHGGGDRRLAVRAAAWDFDESLQVEIGLPVSREALDAGGGPSGASVLWVWAETPDSAERAAFRFPCRPSLVLRIGSSSRRLLLWGLRELVGYEDVVAANKRVAYALRAPQKWAEPESLRIPLPGTFLRVGRARPAGVLVTLMEPENTYDLEAVVGRLKDPPPADGWRKRQEAERG